MSSSNGAGSGQAPQGPSPTQRVGSALTAFGSYGQPQQGQQQQQQQLLQELLQKQQLPYVIDPNQQRQPTLYDRLTGTSKNF